MTFAGMDRRQLEQLTKDLPAPLMLVDLDAFDQNLQRYIRQAQVHGKKLRLASKSLRVPWLIDHALKFSKLIQGPMCFSAREALFLAGQGHDHLLLAYPQTDLFSLQACQELAAMKKKFSMAVDHPQQLEQIEKFWRPKEWGRFPLCLDIDVSFKWGPLHLGARRSSLTSLEKTEHMLELILQKKQLFELQALLTYEAQVASLQDHSPFTPLLNYFKKLFRKVAIANVAAQRKKILLLLQRRKLDEILINAGGSGSMDSSCQDPIPTEVTIGSGLLQSHIFDYISGHHSAPAMLFGLEITRLPATNLLTCHSGGFVASGEMGADKYPLPYMPEKLHYLPMEMAGEVQTPMQIGGTEQFKIGQRVWMRPSKAGEIAERFDHYYLIKNKKIVQQVPTYRGLGQTFY